MPSMTSNLSSSAIASEFSLGQIPQDLFHEILVHAGPVNTTRIQSTSKGVCSAVNRLSESQLQSIGTDDILLMKVRKNFSLLSFLLSFDFSFLQNSKTLVKAVLSEDSKDNRVKAKETESRDLLKLLAEAENSWVLESVASNPNASIEVLKKLAQEKRAYVRGSVAQNPNTPIDVLKKLAQDKHVQVRGIVAQNPNTPIEALKKLAQDKHVHVRASVTKNRNTPLELLQELAQDHNSGVRRNAGFYISRRFRDSIAA